MKSARYILLSLICIIIATSCSDDFISGHVLTNDIETSTIGISSAIIEGEIRIDVAGTRAKYTIEETGMLYSKYKEVLEIISLRNRNWQHDSLKTYIFPEKKEGRFICSLSDLQPSTHYYARAYAIIYCDYPNNIGLLHGNILYGGIKEFITKDTVIIDTIPDIPIHLDMPAGVTAHFLNWNIYSHILIKWENVTDATGYEIYRSSNGFDNTYTLLATSSYNGYEDWKPLIGNNYYKIKAVNGIYRSEMSDSAYCNFSLNNVEPCPPNITSIAGDATALTVSWTYSIEVGCGTPSYFIIRKLNSITGAADSITTTTNTTFVHTSVHPGYNQYWVIAKNDHSEQTSLWNISNEIPLSSPNELNVNKTGTTVVLSWDNVAEATGYQIFYSSTDGTYTLVDEVSNNTTSWQRDFSYASGTIYFKIKAVWAPPHARPVSGVVSGFSNGVSVIF